MQLASCQKLPHIVALIEQKETAPVDKCAVQEQLLAQSEVQVQLLVLALVLQQAVDD